ncbi:hypothetical protein Tco_1023959 [Tanacetum coccineum]
MDRTSKFKIANESILTVGCVDLRSAKVCELGLLNYKAKHVFYPSEKKKFRCRYDYYWASVFEVEYTDHSGHPHMAFAEAPNEALPSDCRPTFNGAWLTKDKFKVNETYDCWYTLGVSKLNLYYDEFFNCQADHPSMMEMLKRYLILPKRSLCPEDVEPSVDPKSIASCYICARMAYVLIFRKHKPSKNVPHIVIVFRLLRKGIKIKISDH